MNEESEVTRFLKSNVSAREFLEGKSSDDLSEDAMISSNFNISPQTHLGWKKEPREYDPDPENTDSKVYNDSDIDDLFSNKKTQMPIIRHENTSPFGEPSEEDFDKVMQEMVKDAGRSIDDPTLPNTLRGLF